jgi:hypothetical protein
LLLALSTVASTAGGDASQEQVSRGLHIAMLGDYVACRAAPGAKPFARGVVAAPPIGNPVSAEDYAGPRGPHRWVGFLTRHVGRGR